MMQDAELAKKLERVLSPELDLAVENMILATEDGFELFGKWSLKRDDGMISVFKADVLQGRFYSSRSAVSYCIAEKYGQFKLSQEIKFLDQEYGRMDCDIQTRTSMLPGFKDRQRRLTVLSKLEDRRIKLKHIKTQLEKCVWRAKYWQIKGFNDEIARTRRPAPNRTIYQNSRKSIRTRD
jgi:hypothetical protein